MSCLITNSYVKISSKHRPGIKRTGFLGVTFHETGNTKIGANAKAHETYYHNLANSNSGSSIGYHCFVDDKEAFFMHPLDEIAWTNGDGNGDGNMKTISVEICVNSDGNFSKARENGAYVAATILHTYGVKTVVGVTGVNAQGNKEKANLFQHRTWMNKNCPEQIRNKGLWTSLVSATQKELDLLWGKETKPEVTELYRVRKTWNDSKSQIGAYSSLTNAKNACKDGYSVFDSNGKNIYSKTISAPTVTPTVKNIDVTYRSYCGGKWYSEIKNYNTTNSMGYSGVENSPIQGFVAKANNGVLKYRVHTIGGKWLGWISQYNINDGINGYAGIKGKNIDAIQFDFSGVSGYKVKYRVSNTGTANYLSWITGYNNTNSMGYAGIFGKPIDKIQVEITK